MRAHLCASAHVLGFCQATFQGHSTISVDDGCKIQRGYFAVAHDLMQLVSADRNVSGGRIRL